MPRTGRPPKPLEQKKRLGNPGKRPLPTPITVISPVAAETTSEGPKSGLELVASLMAAGAGTWIGETDALVTLRLVRDGWDERSRLLEEIDRHGPVLTEPVMSRQGEYVGEKLVANPAVKMLRDLEKQLTVWLSQLGLNPSDRGRLGLATVKARSKLEEMRDRRRAGHRAG